MAEWTSQNLQTGLTTSKHLPAESWVTCKHFRTNRETTGDKISFKQNVKLQLFENSVGSKIVQLLSSLRDQMRL